MSGADLPSGPTPGLTHVLQIGTGAGRDWSAWQAAGAMRITLVEADPERAADLRAAAAGQAGVEVIEAAVSAGPGPRPYYRASLPGLSSFRPPAALKKLFPGLQIAVEEDTRPADPVALARAALPGEEGTEGEEGIGLLGLDVPGEALGILRALDRAGLLTRFGRIHLREGQTPLYEGAPPLAAIAAFLTGAGFETEPEQAPEDPDRPWLTARLNRAALRARRLEAELAQTGAALEALRAENTAAEVAHAATREAAAEAAESARAQAETLRDKLAAARAQAEAAATDRAAAGEAAAREIDTLRGHLAAAQAQIETAAAAEAALRAELGEAQSHAGALAEARHRLDLQAADLTEVQARYQALYAENQALTGLLRDLAAVLEAPAPKPEKPGSARKSPGKTTRKSKGKSGG